MRDLLAGNGESAGSIDLVDATAEEGKAITQPHIWQGSNIAQDSDISISKYDYEDGKDWVRVSCADLEPVKIPLGKTIPTDVTLRITKATEWDMAGEQLGLLFQIYLAPKGLADGIYGGLSNAGIMDILPPEVSPSDLPLIGELLEEIDPFDHTAHVTKDTIQVPAFIDHGGWDMNQMEFVRFHEFGR